jgi:mannitol/fructose-specific phosphotransferase system IIA component (Ntr-type)
MLPRAVSFSETCESLAGYTHPALIVPQLRERDTAGVIKELSELLHQEGCVPDLLAFYHAALNHEFLVNSAVDCGIAFPHARLNGVASSRFAFGRAPEPIIWGTSPSQSVRFVFLLAVPATDAAGFLQLLSALARVGQQDALLTALADQPTGEDIYQFFRQVKVRHA